MAQHVNPAMDTVIKGIQRAINYEPVLGDIQFRALHDTVLSMVGGVPDEFSGEVNSESAPGGTLYQFYWIRDGGFGTAIVLRPEDQSVAPAISGWIRPLSALALVSVDVAVRGGRVVREEISISRRVGLYWAEGRAADVVLDATRSMHEMARPAFEALIDRVLEVSYR